jgi:hypothetical protein
MCTLTGTFPLVDSRLSKQGFKAEATGEFRRPNKGDWFLSGAIVEAYQAEANLSIPYHIARLVRTRQGPEIVEELG